MSAVHTATPVTRPRVEFDEDVETRRSDDDVDYSGWYCVQTDPFSCPVPGCGFVALYLTAAHLVVVWPSRDDSKLLANAYNAKLAGREPRVVEYENDFGPCIAYDEWDRIGRPVHGIASKPDGWDENAKGRL